MLVPLEAGVDFEFKAPRSELDFHFPVELWWHHLFGQLVLVDVEWACCWFLG